MTGIIMVIGFFFVLISPFLSTITFLRYWDEILCLICISISIMGVLKKRKIHKNLRTSRIIKLSLLMVVVGVCGNLMFHNQESMAAIFRDIIVFLKFPIILCTVYNSKFPDTIIKKRGIVQGFVNAIIGIIFICGLVSLFTDIGMSQNEIRHGFKPYMFLASHPTSLVFVMVMLLGVVSMYESCYSKDYIVLYLVISLIIASTMRTKGFALIVVFWYLKLSNNLAKKLKIAYWILVAGVVFAALYSKLSMVASWSGSGRLDLYLGALKLMKMYFPIGSGFGTYASYLSGAYMSNVYSFIHVKEIISLGGKATYVIGDTGYPYYLGQFGALGTILLVILLYNIFRLSYDVKRGELCAVVILMYILIALISEPILANNGAELAVVMGVCAKYIRNNDLKPLSKDMNNIINIYKS